MDLGCDPVRAFLLVTLPLIIPAIVAGWMLAFTLSLDDVVIAGFTTGPGSATLPIRIYSEVRLGVKPDQRDLHHGDRPYRCRDRDCLTCLETDEFAKVRAPRRCSSQSFRGDVKHRTMGRSIFAPLRSRDSPVRNCAPEVWCWRTIPE